MEVAVSVLASIPTAVAEGAGVCFPASDGKRSTSAAGRGILADAARAVDPELAREIEATRDWRHDYLRAARRLTAASAATSEASQGIADAGLASVRTRIAFERNRQTVALAQARTFPPAERLESRELRGEATPVGELQVPYHGGRLAGDALLAQLDRWVERGVVEPSFATAIGRVVEHPEWLALPGRSVAIIGAGAQMGPLEPLCDWGAHVIALDVPRRHVWDRIAETAHRGAGTVVVPVGASGEPGVDVARALPEVRAWLGDCESDRQLVLGMYAYADGGSHVTITAAVDVLAEALLEERHHTALAYLASPTDAFVVPAEVVAAAQTAWRRRGARRFAQAPVRLLTRGRVFAPAYPDGSPVADVLVAQQGPNYALAKRIQRWRGVAATAAGQTVSFNVAPATWTSSVTRNRVLAAAYGGARRFGVEVFRPETSRALMAALLVHDLHEPAGRERHAEELFSDGAAHGGLWRVAYDPRSVLSLAALAGLRHAL